MHVTTRGQSAAQAAGPYLAEGPYLGRGLFVCNEMMHA
jgi:hypothetical protein